MHLRQYGFIRVFRIVHIDKEPEYWATDILDASESDRKTFKDPGWNIEIYHRGIKQFTGVARGHYRLEVSQRNHIGLAIRAFVCLEVHQMRTGISWFDANTGIIRSAMRLYMAHPTITLSSTA